MVVNPFTQSICLMIGTQTAICSYTQIDEWTSIELDGKQLDVHIDYDERLSVSIYDVIEDPHRAGVMIADMDNPHEVDLSIEVIESYAIPYPKAQ